ncbi:1,6-anhydro-N-acetylmuramyl-L-alanine amidase AmpD [Marinobacter fonticola]|uniref:1,6-anhydro-N-acetylmuramyl-L-alanine amidase AmpD n=1 Tax=Marinobacter fonticola TaxID=2603215 RepID=UPI0019311603|nr:1,6-anhydro-N-acetylmuramyl-L-alanine amidase AmpD [Marinobacter fonticola]
MISEYDSNGFSIDQAGWLNGVRHCPSPNFGPRPDTAGITLLVVHNISLPPGRFGGDAIERFFCNRLDRHEHPYFEQICEMKVSAHALVRRNGECIQFVSFLDRAWHAGRSSFLGQNECNDFSIGIELEGADAIPYERVQYQTLARLGRALMARWPQITPDRIAGHSDIAPGRKTDPGPAFSWSAFFEALGAHPNTDAGRNS